MKAPKITKESTAEEVLAEKVDEIAENAESIEDIEKAQRLVENQKKIKNLDKTLDPNTILSVAGSVFLGLTQVVSIIKAEDVRVLTSKAWNFVTKGRLR